jgi:hypothetical protein
MNNDNSCSELSLAQLIKIFHGETYPSGFKSPTRSLLEVLVGVGFVYVFL